MRGVAERATFRMLEDPSERVDERSFLYVIDYEREDS